MSRNAVVSISSVTGGLADHYMITVLAGLWRRMGLSVECGVDYAPEARVCILHHDRTRLDPDRLPVPPAGVKPLNGAVTDISKSALSVLRVTESTRWDGPVIVKTNLNHFGFPESGGHAPATTLGRLREKVHVRLAQTSWRLARRLPPGRYPVLERMDDVPGWVWRDPELIVEKFLPERTGDGLFAIRGWIFFGDREYAYRNVATDRIVKISTTVRHEFFSEVPEALRAIRRRMGFDFGKFDYVEHDGEVYLLDANKTPSYGHPVVDASPRASALSKGIEAYL